MINDDASFHVEPWSLHETTLDLDVLAQAESLFALSNGFLGVRGNLDEGEPFGIPGTYLNGVFELRPLPLGESQYGAPESSQSLVNVTNGKLLRLLVDDEPFDVRTGQLLAHERVLDFRAGTLRRRTEWRSPARRTVRVTSTRMVSFVHRAVLAIAYEVEALDEPVNLVVQSELVANEALPFIPGDPRTAAVLDAPLLPEEHGARGTAALLMHRTRQSGLRIGAAMDHVVTGSPQLKLELQARPDSARVVAIDVLQPGERLRIIKLVAYGWSEERTQPAVRAASSAAST
jgi:alpha,alpha-trehalose phosphorylase